MRYAVISDVHSNLEAFQAVLDDASSAAIDEYLYVGDVVGYAADPKACVEMLGSLRPKAAVAGNHDWAIAGLLDLEWFNESAKEALVWTKGLLDDAEVDYLKRFQIVYEGGDITLVHSTLENPKRFDYVYNAGEMRRTTDLMKTTVCFVGHTHVAGIFSFDGEKVERIRENRVKIDQARRYVINVGSVGQPRDGDPRASYAIYDAATGTVEMRRVEYDIAAAQRKIIHAGLPPRFAVRLSGGY